MLPNDDLYLLAVLNSPVIWWYTQKFLPPALNGSQRPFAGKMKDLPIAPPTDAIRAGVEPAVARLIALTQNRRERVRELLDWLRIEFAVEKPGQKLETFAGLESAAFIEEVRRRRAKGQPKLSPAGLRQLSETFADYAAQIKGIDAESLTHERTISDLVNLAYGLTPAEIDLMWQTAPPRMPGIGKSLTP
jgi:hypothetical protein